MTQTVDWRPSTEQRDLILEGLAILWDEAEEAEFASAVLNLREELRGAPVIEP